MEQISLNKKLDTLENEILSMKLLLMKLVQKKKAETLQLEGVLGNIDVSEEDIAEAKSSMFKK